jgi:putative ABC transport system permease protein
LSSRAANEVYQRRAPVPHTSMFLRMLVRAAVLRRGRAASALLAMVVAAAVATAMLNLYVDVQAKLRGEFRKYGANVVVVAKDGQELPANTLQTAASILGSNGLAVPFAYAVARTGDGHSVVVAGTDLQRVRQLNSWWSVSAWPQAPHDALVGKRALGVVGTQGKPLKLSFQGRLIELNPAGTVQTGAAEDDRVYLSLADFTEWTHVPYSTVEISASGPPERVDTTIQRLAQALPGADVRPVRQIMEGEARVLGKMRSTLLIAAILIILTAALGVLSTLMGWVADRHRDFAIMKALGGSARIIQGFFAAEAATLGATGAVLGFAIGVGVAIWIGRVNFHSAVSPRLSVLPAVLLGGIAISLVAAIVPISLLRRVQPANILRGE